MGAGGGGGVGGPPPRPLSGLCGRGGGGSGGGAFGPLAMPPVGQGGGGAAWQSWPRGPAIGQGVAPFPRPPLPRAGFSRRPSLGPLIPRLLSGGAGRPGVAVRVSGQWLAGCGAAGFPPRLLSPHSLPREVARRFPWAGNKAGVTGVVLSMGGVAPHTTPVRAHPASLGTICAASRCAGVGPLVLRGPHLSRRLGRGGGSHTGSPLGQGGSIPPASGAGGRGPRGWWAGGGAGGGAGGCRAAASLLSFRAAACGTPFWLSLCRRRAPFRRARAVGAEVPPRGGGGVRGGPWTAPLGAPADLKPPLCHLGVGCGYGRVMWGAASFLFRCARCSGTPVWVRGSRSSRRCPYRVAVPPEGGGAPPALGGRRAAPVAPQLRWVRGGGGGGVGGPPPRPPSGPCGRGGGGVGGALWSPGDASRRPGGRGGGGMAILAPGASHRPGGRALLPPPSIESRILAQALAGAPHPPAVVARRWPAGGGPEG